MQQLHKRTIEPDSHDHRDHQFCHSHGEKSPHYADITCPTQLKQKIAEHTKAKVDLRSLISAPIINQGLLNSCSACAISVAVEVYLHNENQPFIFNTNDKTIKSLNASQMFIYYNERVMENKVDLNEPVFIRDGFISLFNNGTCSDLLWPYPETTLPNNIKALVESGTTQEVMQALNQALAEHETELHAIITQKPSIEANNQAQEHKISRYCSLSIDDGLAELKLSLSKGIPFVFGMMVPKSFYITPKNGMMPPPAKDEARLGGHALLAVGYDDEKQVFIVRNSWGEEFGDKGYCYIPYDFFTSSYTDGETTAANTFSFWCLTTQ